MRVLVACEFSGTVRDAFRALGHDAMSCDILPTEADGPHYQGDVRDVLGDGWDLMVAHPPCTYLSRAGVRWLHSDPDRWALMEDAAAFMRLLLEADVPLKAVENPVMHRYGRERVGRMHDQLVNPYQFGHAVRKATCLWLEGLPPLVPTTDLKAETVAKPLYQQQPILSYGPSADRWKKRSLTFPGIAAAMAAQWGGTITQERSA